MSTLRGRFAGETSPRMQRFSSSLDIDLQMLDEDVDGSIAHATMLGETGILAPGEAAALRAGLVAVREEIRTGTWVPDARHEDVHMAVEARLTERLGPLGQRLHTARSRNDQVATDVRLWLKRRLPTLQAALRDLIAALLARVAGEGDALMPGYTHLQRGQPILLAHHLLAHAWPLERDHGRLADALDRLDRCPLGAAALAGTPHPIDRQLSASLLGFAAPVDNAMDAVAARDHLQEVVAACAILLGHLSRQAEDLVLWSSQEWSFVRLGEAHATGSSIMPQKRNPDAAELVRGKSGRVFGDLVALLTLTKGLPLAYNRDLQEDRAALFDAVTTAIDCVALMAEVWSAARFATDRFVHELRGDFSLSTEVADWLAARGVPFREAHEAVGRLVHLCEQAGEGSLRALSSERAADVHPVLAEASPELWLDPKAAVERRRSLGGTAPSEVARQVSLLEDFLAAHRAAASGTTG
jgi:argininosuccinate lyase